MALSLLFWEFSNFPCNCNDRLGFRVWLVCLYCKILFLQLQQGSAMSDLQTLDGPRRPAHVALREWNRINTAVWKTLKCTTIVDDSLAEDFQKDRRSNHGEEEFFFTPPTSSSALCNNSGHSKRLEEFLEENAARSTVSVPRLETPIRAQKMLDMHTAIVQQLLPVTANRIGPVHLPTRTEGLVPFYSFALAF
jgi:hypothetical protein